MVQPLNARLDCQQRNKLFVVNISDLKAVKANDGMIVTHSLGSCLGVTLFDANAGVGGMLHALLPDSSNNLARAQSRPGMFVDTGFDALMKAVTRLGASANNLTIKLAGGGNFLDKQGHFQIGTKNYEMIKTILRNRRMIVRSEDCGGTKPRSLYLNLKTGETMIRSRGEEYEI